MTAVLLAIGLVVAAGALVAVGSSDPRLGVVALAVALVAAALLADPLPGPAVLGVRLTAALLAVALLRAAVGVAASRGASGDRGSDGPSHLGWPTLLLLGIAGAITGLAIGAGLAAVAPAGVGGATPGGSFLGSEPATASTITLGLGCALGAIGLPALLTEPLGRRRALAGVIVVEAAILARAGLAGPPDALEEVILGGLLVAVAAAAALLVAASRSLAEGGAHPT